MTKSILEQAVIQLLNNNEDKAVDLFHKVMVEHARNIAESLRQGEEIVLAEGWDDEISSETYYDDDDLNGAEDGDEDTSTEMADDGDNAPDTDLGDVGDVDGLETGDEAAEPAELDDRLDDIEDQLEKLASEFEAAMADLGISADDDEGDLTDGSLDGEDEGLDDTGAVDDVDQDVTDSEALPAVDDENAVEEDDDLADFDDLDDITESVLDELEKVSALFTTDGQEVGSGKKITQNDKSSLPNNGGATSKGTPVMTKDPNPHTGYERETAPVVKDAKLGRNVRKKFADGNKTVPAGGDKSALINKDYAGSKNNKSAID